MDDTWIKLYRSLLDWCWFKDANTLQVFIYLLLKATIKDIGVYDITLKRGEVAASISTISVDTGLSVRNVRTAINHLKSTGEVTSRICPKFSVFTVVKYDQYQMVPTSEVTSDRQATDKRPTRQRQATDNTKRKQEKKNTRKQEYIYIARENFTNDEELRGLILDFYEARAEMKKPMTDRAVDMLLNKLKKFPLVQQKAMLKEAILGGWQNIYPSKQSVKQPQSVYSSEASYDLEEFKRRAIGMKDWHPPKEETA